MPARSTDTIEITLQKPRKAWLKIRRLPVPIIWTTIGVDEECCSSTRHSWTQQRFRSPEGLTVLLLSARLEQEAYLPKQYHAHYSYSPPGGRIRLNTLRRLPLLTCGRQTY